MTERGLCTLRERLESLACDRGEYYLVCGRYGDRPVPATGCRFESRAVAQQAADVTERYRATLREYDPQLPQYDIIVCQTPAVDSEGAGTDVDGSTPKVE